MEMAVDLSTEVAAGGTYGFSDAGLQDQVLANFPILRMLSADLSQKFGIRER
jgi:hypothetical protein